jgi:hypothetical protein
VALALAAWSGSASAWAQDAKDPETALKELNTWYSEQFKKVQDAAKEAKTQPDYRPVLTERTERAKAAIKDIDPEKVDPAKGLALAQLSQAAQDNAKMVAAAKRFLTSNPEAQPKYTAHQLMLQGYSATDDADGIISVLSDIKPPTPQMQAFLAANVAARYADIVADKKGPEAGLALIAKAEAAVPFAELLAKPDVEVPARDNQPARKQPSPEKSAAESAIVQIAMGRSDLLNRQGKKDEALAALEMGKAKLPSDSRMMRSLDSKIKLAKIVGTPAPALKQDRGYGNFKSLDEYKGKVVVVEFTAHW